jgi:hypothetical protein
MLWSKVFFNSTGLAKKRDKTAKQKAAEEVRWCIYLLSISRMLSSVSFSTLYRQLNRFCNTSLGSILTGMFTNSLSSSTDNFGTNSCGIWQY